MRIIALHWCTYLRDVVTSAIVTEPHGGICCQQCIQDGAGKAQDARNSHPTTHATLLVSTMARTRSRLPRQPPVHVETAIIQPEVTYIIIFAPEVSADTPTQGVFVLPSLALLQS